MLLYILVLRVIAAQWISKGNLKLPWPNAYQAIGYYNKTITMIGIASVI